MTDTERTRLVDKLSGLGLSRSEVETIVDEVATEVKEDEDGDRKRNKRRLV